MNLKLKNIIFFIVPGLDLEIIRNIKNFNNSKSLVQLYIYNPMLQLKNFLT
jgi:hypothetical protein